MPDMPVPLPRMCSVLAHELRSPLSVIQGYVRILQRQRDVDPRELAMLDAILDATGRLTTIARQASDLGNWLHGLQTRAMGHVPLTALTTALTERLRASLPHAVLRTPPSPTPERTWRVDPAAFAGAIATLAESMQRDDESAMIEVTVTAPPDHDHVDILIEARPSKDHPPSAQSRPGAPRALALDRGGSGLALVAASHVLDAHTASIDPASVPGRILIQLPHSGGAS